MKFRPSQKMMVFVYSVTVFLFCHHFIFRPVILDWGAPAALQKAEFSGDVFTQRGSVHTRAVLIHAAPEEIWPWLMQIGQDRGGFYSYQWMENLFRAGIKNVYEIKTEFQYPRRVGDTIWLADRNHYRGRGYQILVEAVPLKSLVMVGSVDYARIQSGRKAMGSWAFYVYPEGPGRTWLIARSSDGNLSFGNRLLRYFFFEVPHFVMERRMLINVQKLAETAGVPVDQSIVARR